MPPIVLTLSSLLSSFLSILQACSLSFPVLSMVGGSRGTARRSCKPAISPSVVPDSEDEDHAIVTAHRQVLSLHI